MTSRLEFLKATMHLVACFLALSAGAQEARSDLTFSASADFLALHVTGMAPGKANALEYRFADAGQIDDRAPWLPAKITIGPDGSFVFDLPLPASRWSALQMRALHQEEVLAKRDSHPHPRAFRLLTAERVAALPESERERWSAHIRRSNERFEKEFDVLAAECRQLGLAKSNPAPASSKEVDLNRAADAVTLAGDEARRLADAVISYQTPSGGWSKAIDYSAGPRSPGTHWTGQSVPGWHYCGTLDNRATTKQIRFLSAVHTATGREDAKASALRGIEWLLAAQYPNGGWPQNYPIEPGYHEAITLNDDAMLHAIELLLDISEGKAPFAFIDRALRARSRAAVDQAIACLAGAQVKVGDQPTVWCAQHDPLTLAPVAARKFEPASLSGSESAELLKFLMRRTPAHPGLVAVVEPAIAWLQTHRVTGLRRTRNAAGKTDYVADPASAEIYWARFYDVETGKPVFVGRDQVSYPTFSAMAERNEVGYDYFTTKPRDLIEKEVVHWRERMASPR